jgi:DNA-binding transcriptional MerR regulator
MSDTPLTIGAVAARTGCSVPTIRYYEQIGLLPSLARSANGHRYYSRRDLTRLGFIKRCRDFGFPIEQVRVLAQLFDDGDRACSEVRDQAQMHLDEVRFKLADMRQLEASLELLVGTCDAACSTGPTRDCCILVDLAAT